MWTMACAVMIDTPGRLVGYGLRFGQYAAIALLMIYIVNARSLTARKILDALTAYWVFVIVGGYLGMLWPDTRLTATVGRLLPAQLLANDYISDLAFPPFAEVQTPFGAIEPFLRPSAPFAYANGWGAAMAFLTPVAIGAALYRGTRQSLMLTLLALAAALPPAVVTSNRGMYIALVVGTSYLLLRLLMRGHWRLVASVGLGAAGILALLVALGFNNQIAARQDVVDTSAGRANLYRETLERTLDSPVLGYGAPRPALTSEIAAGTQGAVWNAMFSFGFVGLALFLIFIVGAAIRTARVPTLAGLWLHTALVTAVVMSLYYGLDRLLLPFAFVTALLLRERETGRSRLWPTPKPP